MGALFPGVVAASAHNQSSPQQIIEGFYNSYIFDPAHPEIKRPKPNALKTIRSYASKSFAKAIDAENRCTHKTHEICAIDSDIIIDGQDWDISQVSVTKEKNTENTQIIRAQFLNFNRNHILRYFFIKENNIWKIDEIETTQSDANGGTEDHWMVKKNLITALKELGYFP